MNYSVTSSAFGDSALTQKDSAKEQKFGKSLQDSGGHIWGRKYLQVYILLQS